MPKKYCSTLFYFSVFLLIQGKIFAGTTPPTTVHTLDPATPNGENGWYVSPVNITLTATDLESGVKEINYQIDGGSWNKVNFSNSLNRAPNPSFEDAGATTSGLDKWEASVVDGATYSQDTTVYYPGFDTSSAKIDAGGGNWHGINHKNNYVVASYLDNMTASIMVRSPSTTGQSRFRIYAIDSNGISTEIAESAQVIGKSEWTYITLDFTVSVSDAVGVYMDVGITGNGTLWADAASISTSQVDTSVDFVVGSDSILHTINYYSVDYADNTEVTNTFTFKVDQTPPGNWRDSGATRSITGPSDHHLYVYVTLDDLISGLSSDTNKFQYMPEAETEFGVHDDLMQCSSDWYPNTWAGLLSGAIIPGTNTTTLMTPKTDLCNSNWKVCKTVRFYAKDMAGNESSKDFCINGPWIRVRGGSFVRANHNISMIAEGEDNNTDGLIEASGGTIDFFTSSEGWNVTSSDIPVTYSYSELYDMTPIKTTITDETLIAQSGTYEINSSIELKNANLPSGFGTGSFDQVVFINGDLIISTDIDISDSTTVLFVVNGNVEIDKNVDNVNAGIVSEGDMYTAYNIQEGQNTGGLAMRGLFSANKFYFQRTNQGTGSEIDPSEDIIFEPKYLVKLRDRVGGSTVRWLSTE